MIWRTLFSHFKTFLPTAGGLKSDRNGFTKMRVTALIIV